MSGWVFVSVHGLLSNCCVKASRCCGFSCCRAWVLEPRHHSCGAQAQLLLGMCNLPRRGMEPVFPASVGRFFTAEPLAKPLWVHKAPRSLSYYDKAPFCLGKQIHKFGAFRCGHICGDSTLLNTGARSCLELSAQDLQPSFLMAISLLFHFS